MNIGVFTTIKVSSGIPLFFEKHKERLLSHAAKLNLGQPKISLTEVQNYLQKNNLHDCALKMTVSKNKDKTLITLQSRPLPSEKSCKLITVEDTRTAIKIYKTTDRIINEQTTKIAQKNGADDALFTLDGNIIESTISNVFSINKHGVIITPPIKNYGLNGITRQLIIENETVIEETIPETTNGPLVLVNALRIQKVSHLNGRELHDGENLQKKIKTLIEKKEKAYIQKSKRAKKNNETKSLHYEILPSWFDPELVFDNLFGKESCSFWLDSSLTNAENRFSYMGASPKEIYSYFVGNKQKPQEMFVFLEKKLAQNLLTSDKLPFPFVGGFVGYFGYEMQTITERKFKQKSQNPDSLWYFVDKFIAFDHKEKKIYLVC